MTSHSRSRAGYLPGMGDPSTAAEEVRLAAIRALTPAQRLRLAFDLSESMRRLALSGLRARHPDRTDLELVALYAGTPGALRAPGTLVR